MFKMRIVPAAVASATICEKNDCCGTNQETVVIAGKIPNRLLFLLLLYLKDCCCCTKRSAVIDGVVPRDRFPALFKRTDAFAGAIPK
jgi:hypothetical protein